MRGESAYKQGTFPFVFCWKGESMQERHKYAYDGPVMEFDRCITGRWKGQTIAPTERKARCNLVYQYKKEHNKAPYSYIRLPGKIVMVEDGGE